MNKRKLITKSLIIICYIFSLFFIIWAFKAANSFQQNNNLINICTFPDLIDQEIIKQFEKETGIKVQIKYCDSDIEIWSQLYITRGKGYDLVTPTDFVTNKLKNNKLLQKIPESSLIPEQQINYLPSTTNLSQNYAIPFAWTFYGIAYNKDFFTENKIDKPNSWQYIFQPEKLNLPKKIQNNYQTIIFDDNLQDILILTQLYLQNKTKINDQNEIVKIINTLKQQQKHLYGFVTSDVKYYLNGIVPIALCQSAAPMHKLLAQENKFNFTIPDEGSVFLTQNFCIPIGSNKQKLVMKFIKFALQEKVALKIYNHSGFLPTSQAIKQKLPKELRNTNLIPSTDQMKKLYPIDLNITEEEAEKIWLKIKS